MLFLKFSQCQNILPDIFPGTPYSPKEHNRLAIMLQVAALVTVDVNNFGHISSELFQDFIFFTLNSSFDDRLSQSIA